MLEGEPSWLAAFGRPAKPFRQAAEPPLSLISGRSGYALHVQLGEKAHRPAVAEREETAVILDGVLLDRRPLTSALGSRASAETEGDAALVLSAYLKLGERVLPMLRGSLGLVIWDSRRDTSVVRSGSHRLPSSFFSLAGDGVLVSASHGTLLEAGRVPADLDRLAIARWVVQGSIFRGEPSTLGSSAFRPAAS